MIKRVSPITISISMFHIFKNKTKTGFTLIELLVVIAIIGVLASIVLASLNTARRKSRDARRVTDIKQLQLALELYYDGVGGGQYTQAIAGAAACNSTTLAYGLETLVTNNYIPQIPRDPQSTTAAPICYLYAGPAVGLTKTTYHLAATLEDTGNQALTGDKDCNSAVVGDCVTGLPAYTNGFDGTTAASYDVIP